MSCVQCYLFALLFVMLRRPPLSTRTSTLLPYATPGRYGKPPPSAPAIMPGPPARPCAVFQPTRTAPPSRNSSSSASSAPTEAGGGAARRSELGDEATTPKPRNKRRCAESPWAGQRSNPRRDREIGRAACRERV